tara:strand:- start:1909 stop:2103 length:195 start_codon:yes stop_codon:yes gene_type:complete
MNKDKQYLVIFKKDNKITTAHKFKNYTLKNVLNEFTNDGWQWNDKLLYVIDGTKIVYQNENTLT